jgi:hypothetical protein
MPCDERYRAWVMRRDAEVKDPPPELRSASVTAATKCPARAGFVELRFDVDGVAWSWCFPETGGPDGQVQRSQIRILILRPGAHGLTAEAVVTQQAGGRQVATLSPGTAAELAVSGVPVFVHHSLVAAET